MGVEDKESEFGSQKPGEILSIVCILHEYSLSSHLKINRKYNWIITKSIKIYISLLGMKKKHGYLS
jgi:hypothetical protein